jgi:hypothetical protein
LINGANVENGRLLTTLASGLALSNLDFLVT